MARPMEAWRRGTSPGIGPVSTSTTFLGAPEMALEGTVRVNLPRGGPPPPRLDPSGSPPNPWGQREPKSEGGAGQQRAYIDRISKHFGRTQSSGAVTFNRWSMAPRHLFGPNAAWLLHTLGYNRSPLQVLEIPLIHSFPKSDAGFQFLRCQYKLSAARQAKQVSLLLSIFTSH